MKELIARYNNLVFIALLFVVFYFISFTLAPSTYTISGDSVYTESSGKGVVLQKPHTLNDLSNFPIINFTSQYPQANNFDVLIGFTGNSAKVISADVWESYSHSLVNQNCTMSWSNTSSQNGTWDNHTSNACYPYTYSETYPDWKPLTVSYSEYAGKNYFSVSNISVNSQETKTLRPRIEIFPVLGGSSGKYEILVKPSESTLSQALDIGDRVLLDPWWNQTWRSCKNLNTTDVTGRNWTDTVQVNVSGMVYSNTYELRVVNQTCEGSGGFAQNYKVVSNGTSDNIKWAELRFKLTNSRTTTTDNYTVWSVFYDPDKEVANPNYAYTNSLNATFNWPRDYFNIYNSSSYSGSINYDGYPIAGCTSRDMLYSNSDTGFVQATPQSFTPNMTSKYVVINFNINCGGGGTNVSVWYNDELVGFFDRTSTVPWQRLGNAPLNNSRYEDFAIYRKWTCGAAGGSAACGAGGGDNQQRWFFYIPVAKYVSGATLKLNQTGNWLGIVDDVRFTNATTEEFGYSPFFETLWNTAVGEQSSISSNETDARNAIELGINDTIPNSARYPDQWIHVRNSSGQQTLGKFDRVAVSGNQTWAFNFLTDDDDATNMQSIGRTVDIWENVSLTADTIRTQVGAFINATKW